MKQFEPKRKKNLLINDQYTKVTSYWNDELFNWENDNSLLLTDLHNCNKWISEWGGGEDGAYHRNAKDDDLLVKVQLRFKMN